MQAIICKYLPATNTRGARIKATCGRGSLTIAYDHELDREMAHVKAADALCAQFVAEDMGKRGEVLGPWSDSKARGQLPSGEWVFCFVL